MVVFRRLSTTEEVTVSSSNTTTMKALRVHSYGDPTEVLHLDNVPIPMPGAGQVRVRVHACALNPADWAVCRDSFPTSTAWDWVRCVGHCRCHRR